MSEQNQKILGALEHHREHFRGVLWQPRRLIGSQVVALLMGIISEMVKEVIDLPLDDLPTSSSLRRMQHEVEISLELARRNRLQNQGDFFFQVGVIFDKVGSIYEELSRLERMGYFLS